MSKTINKLLSEVQSDLGDLSQDMIQEGEYIDFVNDAISEVAKDTEAWISRVVFTHTGATAINGFSIPTNNISNADLTVGYIAPFRIYHVMKGDGVTMRECREFSGQAVANVQVGDNPFPINWSNIGPHAFRAFRDGVDSLRIEFADMIMPNEVIWIDVITSQPLLTDVWYATIANGNAGTPTNIANTQALANSQNTVPIQIPDFLYNPIKYKTLAKALQRLFVRGDSSKFNTLNYVEQKAKEEVLKAVYHVKMHKDVNSRFRLQPLNWLPE